MEVILFFLLLVLAMTGLYVFTAYHPAILHIEFIVKRLTNCPPQRFGDLFYSNGCFIIKGLLFKSTFTVAELVQITGYSEITMGLEDTLCIDFHFHDGSKLLFDGSKSEQQNLINYILINDLDIVPIKWNGVFTFSNDLNKEYQTIYKL